MPKRSSHKSHKSQVICASRVAFGSRTNDPPSTAHSEVPKSYLELYSPSVHGTRMIEVSRWNNGEDTRAT